MRSSAGTPSLRARMSRWIAVAARSASVALPNSTSRPSPTVRTMRPWLAVIAGSVTSARTARSRVWVPVSLRSISRA